MTLFALSGAQKKRKKFHIFMVCAISHSLLGYAQWPWFLKNDHLLTFAPIESDLSVVRPPRLLWEIDMIMRKLANTNFMSWESQKIFSRTLKWLSSIQQTLFWRSLWDGDSWMLFSGKYYYWAHSEILFSFLDVLQRLEGSQNIFWWQGSVQRYLITL